MRKIFGLALCALFFMSFHARVFAAIGCSLDEPDRDVKRLFPDSSGYKTTFITLKEIGGEPLKSELEAKLGDKFDQVYENMDVPYAYYTVLKGKEPIGYIHGVNQKGKFGVLQLVLAVNLDGKIRDLYYQKISSPESAKFRASGFTGQFKDLGLADFAGYDVSGKSPLNGRLAKISDPSQTSSEDFKATLRGIKKDLILLEEFLRVKPNKGGS
jgi:hypothetical protein